MLEHNQFGLKPGAYQHYKGGIFVVENVLTHQEEDPEGPFMKLQDPLVIYRNLEQQFETLNGGNPKQIIKTYSMPISLFMGNVMVSGELIKRFKAL